MAEQMLGGTALKVGLPQIKVLAVAAVIAALYSDVISALVREWLTRPAASHGILVPPIAGYVTWLRRYVLFARPAVPDNRGLLAVAGACMLLLIGTLGAELLLMRISLIVMVAGLVVTFWGWRRLRILTFPLLLLATMIPIPQLIFNTLSGPLQVLASYLATEATQMMGVAAYRDGNVIQLAGITLGVAEACSGLNSLSTLIVTAMLISPLYPSRLPARVILLLSSPPLAITMNVLRVAGTAILADSRPELALGFYHTFSGWAVFLTGFLVLLGLARLLQRFFRLPSAEPTG